MDSKKQETLAEQLRRHPKGGVPSRSIERGGPAPRSTRDIVIGLDFGTSCTKVVIQDPALRKAWAVPFDELAVKGNAYLLPTKLVLGSDGSVSLSGAGSAVLDLKLKLMAEPDTPLSKLSVDADIPTPRQLCIAYLALVLRRTRAWLTSNLTDIYQGVELAWKVNIGVPSSTLSNSGQIDTFAQVACGAWKVSLRAEPIVWSEVVKVAQASRVMPFDFGVSPVSLNVYPEIAAEITGYARSDARRPGLHMMIDIGASTLDVSTFMLHEDGGEKVGFLQTEVQKLGAFYLHRWRVKSLSRCIESRFNPLDMFSPTPDDLHEMLPTDTEIDSIDGPFSDACRNLLGSVLVTTKKRRAPREPQFRHNGAGALPVFVCGGGSLLKFYKEMIHEFDESLRRGMVIGRFDIQSLPVPPRLEVPGLPSADYHRLAVAYGLSFRYLDLPSVTAPDDIPDIESMRVREQAELISKDMV